MNYFDLYSSYPDRTIAAAWDSQVKEVDKAPWLTGTLTESGGELFARFAACYAELRTLPRGARRALQRRLARSSELTAILPEYLQQGGRRLQHRMAWSLAGAALLLALGQGVATAATITVTTNDPRIIPDGQCSLVEAIVNANNDAATHADCPAGSSADTIVLPANANVMLIAVYCNLYYGPPSFPPICRPTGLPSITSRITIEGNGATIARQGGAPAFGLMAVRNSGDLTLERVTLSGGGGGGVGSFAFGGLLNNGTLSIKNSIISGNGVGSSGVSNGGTLTIENSIISDNASGGVSNIYGTVTIESSTISGNANGGLHNSGTLGIANSTISGNTTNFGGGGVSNSGVLTITNSTISDNRANRGGGVTNSGGRLTITNSTISGNRANAAGGLLNTYYCYYSFGCSSGTLTLNNSLIAGNQAPVAPEIENFSPVGIVSIVNANNFNLFGTNGNAGVSGFTPGPADIVPSVGVAQILGPLKFNGGPTQTHGLVAGSPAIDVGDPGGCRDSQGALLSTDQRGFARHIDGNNDGTARCDIGAVEFNRQDFPASLVKPAFTASSFPAGSFLAGGVETVGLARGPAFQLFNSAGALEMTRFVLNPDFGAEVSFTLGNLDFDPADEILVGGRETSGLARGPAFQIFDSDGTLTLSQFVLNSDFTQLSFAVANLGSSGVLVCGTETGGLARGPAFQFFDNSGTLRLTRFVLNQSFTANQCLAADLNSSLIGDEIVTGGTESSGLVRGPAFQIWDKNGNLLTTPFVLNPDFTETKFAVANLGSKGVIAYGRETVGAMRGPAYQLWDGNGNFLLTRFALNPDFTGFEVFGANTTNAVPGDEIVTAGLEISGLARGPAIQVWDRNGNHLFTRFVLNPDFTEVSFTKIDIHNDGVDEILVVGSETKGLERGPAFQLFDGSGNLLVTQFVLNEDFTNLKVFVLDYDGDGDKEIGIGGVETRGFVRGPAYQIFESNGTLVQSQFVLNPDF